MSESDIYDEFERLWRSFRVCRQSADALKSPNPEDDDFIKIAIVGFSYHDKTENWREGHLKIVKGYGDECARLGDPPKTKQFNLLALGALLGLYSAGRIDDRLYGIGCALLPGFVLSKGSGVETL